MRRVEHSIEDELVRQVDIRWDFVIHESLWGVPCGPTLSMVNPPKLMGGVRSTRGFQ